MPRAGSASLLCIAVAAVACGAGRRDRAVVFDTARPVIALDVRDGVFAWASSSPVYNAHCGTRFWRWIPGRRAEALPVPAKYATACLDSPGPVGGVDLSPTAVGWTIDDEGGNTGEILYGASMAGARHSVAFAHEFTNGGAGPKWTGELVAGVAATSGGVVLGDATSCLARSRPTRTNATSTPWRAGARAASRAAVSVSGAAAASGHCPFRLPRRSPRTARSSRSSRGRGANAGSGGGEHYGRIVIATTAGRVVASIPSRKLAPLYGFDGMTMSDGLLAFDGYRGVSVYHVPDARFLASVVAPKQLRSDSYSLAVGDRDVIFWTSERAYAVDVASGRVQRVDDVSPSRSWR